MATNEQRKGDFGIKVLQPHASVVPKPEAAAKVDLSIQVLKTNGYDMTVERASVFEKELKIEKMDAWATIGELKQQVEDTHGIAKEDQRFFCEFHRLPDHVKIGQCYVDVMGYGMEYWPPHFILKPAVKGVEVVIDVPPMRDTAFWQEDHVFWNGEVRLREFVRRLLIFDVYPDKTTVLEVKGMMEKKLGIPEKMQKLFTEVLISADGDEWVDCIEMENEKTVGEYGLDQGSVIRFQKFNFDEDGNYIFDDYYFDSEGFHDRPSDSHITGPITTE